MSAELKKRAAEYAACYVENGMVIGLGSGTTAAYAVRRIGLLLRTGRLKHIQGVPTSLEVADLARLQGIPLTTLEEHPALDVTIDGADEVDPQLNLIKGRGGALLHEKIVAGASRSEVIVVDESKLVECLGERAALPVEVIPFGWKVAFGALGDLGGRPALRQSRGEPVRTLEGNFILDCHFGPIQDAVGLDGALCAIPGVVEHGLFVGLTSLVVVAGRGGVRELRPGDESGANLEEATNGE
jgi:ribose 5-phosphate isomerase A